MRIAALIALVAGLISLSGCGDDNGKTTTIVKTVTETTATQTGTQTAAGAVESFEAFQTPSKNVGCVASDGFARCDIRDRAWQPPAKPADCDVDFGQGLSITAGEPATFVCAGDTALNADAPVLAYGKTNKIGLVSCESEQAGVTCRDEETGRGFFISRGSYKLL